MLSGRLQSVPLKLNLTQAVTGQVVVRLPLRRLLEAAFRLVKQAMLRCIRSLVKDSGQVAAGLVGAPNLDQVLGEIAPECLVGQRHQPQVWVDFEHMLEGDNGPLAVFVIVSHDSS